MIKGMLSGMFGMQFFEKNEHLERLIKETEERYSNDLSDEDLSLVNAAGYVAPKTTKNEGEK